MANLSLCLLGPPRVKLDEATIEVKPRKALALLIYLAVTANRHARDALATLLWPDSDQHRARHALRNRLSELKRTLGGDWLDAEIERSLDFLNTPLQNMQERHHSLRVVFEKAWERLSPAEQSVLQQLSVFRGGCTREAAE
jgi:hypothetical protein